MKLVIDIGNTLIKIGYFDKEGHLVKDEKVEDLDNFKPVYDVSSCLISNVRNISIPKFSFKTLVLSHNYNLNFKNLYESKETLGTDRIANIAGACGMFKGKNNLIFSFGTCITIDYLNENNEFLGGNISPGVDIRFKSMHEFTGKLPLSEVNNYNPLFGKTTYEALANGVIKGIINEINGYIQDVKLLNSEVNIIFCGGYSNYFAKQLNCEIFAVPNLGLYGLYNILILNEF